MGRAPCCDKANVKKGPWSPEEDAKLKSYIEKHGTGGNWIALPHKIGLKRCGKSCRLRWLNYLRPNIKHGCFSEEEDRVICSLYLSIGSRWSIIAAQLPGRTDNDIKNYWNTRLKKKLLGKEQNEQQARRRNNNNLHSTNSNDLNQGAKLMREQIGNGPMMSGCIKTNLVPSWPELPLLPSPIPYSNDHDSLSNDQASIRKLLINLGGKFYEDELTYQDGVSINPVSNHLPFRPSYNEMVSSGESSSSSMVYNNIGGLDLGLPMFGEVGFANPQISEEGIEFLYEDMAENRNGDACGMSNSCYPPFGNSNYEGLDQEGVLLGCNNDDQLVHVGG